MKLPQFDVFYDAVDANGIDGGGSPEIDAAGGGGGNDAPSHFDLKDDSLIRVGDQKEPVQFGKWYKGIQGQLTKASQDRANFERQAAERDNSFKELKTQYDKLAASIQEAKRTGDKTDALEQLRKLQYLSGEDAAAVVEAFQSRIGQVDSAFAERDRAILFLGQKLADALRTMQGFQGRQQETDFSSKIGQFLKEGGYGEELRDLATEIYLAYEGDDLDAEFPAILKNRVEQITRWNKAAEQKRIAQQKQNLFVPGKGGQGSPSGSLKTKLARGKAKDIAGDLWDAMVSDNQPSNRT